MCGYETDTGERMGRGNTHMPGSSSLQPDQNARLREIFDALGDQATARAGRASAATHLGNQAPPAPVGGRPDWH